VIDAKEFVDFALRPKPELVVHAGDLPATAEAVRDLLADSGKFFDRGVPVRLVRPADGSTPSAIALTKHSVVIETHRLVQPVKFVRGNMVEVTLPDRVAQMYLDMGGEYGLPPLAGISTGRYCLVTATCAFTMATTARRRCGAAAVFRP
jgi:hypothetical protein